ncbi:hypothetical protein A3D77_05900 [Candidatus Gottesmanbacteria bacterium RIFCSPHIGHO2_02_FULL_39_11]|uniref:Uncharacterized protein n=1 Tax=Candidatus Gottesmanbacteria bacterium RIFCSPHIGHO2_02_FULL_39_11 TaxID=1798382 RepID=A0A1F5ZSX5_9BACT|nr:MAG: hypothetical protein A3D77_05900 [Candidatus Gottesmanbacteria bacterium RIFCSPHIGHO2_02_FULL_39_11]
MASEETLLGLNDKIKPGATGIMSNSFVRLRADRSGRRNPTVHLIIKAFGMSGRKFLQPTGATGNIGTFGGRITKASPLLRHLPILLSNTNPYVFRLSFKNRLGTDKYRPETIYKGRTKQNLLTSAPEYNTIRTRY